MRIGSSNVTVLVAGEGAAADSDESPPVADAVTVEAVIEDITLERFGVGSFDEAPENMSGTMRSRISSVDIPRSSPMPDKSLRVTGCGKHDQSGDKGGGGKRVATEHRQGRAGKGLQQDTDPGGWTATSMLVLVRYETRRAGTTGQGNTKPVARARRVKAG